MKVLIYVDNMPSKVELCIKNINNFYETQVKQRLSEFFIHTQVMIGLTGLIEINCQYSRGRVIDGNVSNTKTYILAKTFYAVLYRFEQQIDKQQSRIPIFS